MIQKEHIVKEGVYIPEMGEQYPERPDERMVPSIKIRDVKIDENYPYLMKSFKDKLLHILQYLGIFVLVFPLQKIRYGLKIQGRDKLRKNKALLKNGALTVSNHVYRWDFLAVLQAVRYRREWFPTFADNMENKDAGLIRNAGGIPIPEQGMGSMRKFNEAFDTLHARRKWIHVFPESCRWNWYQPIRPFKQGAFYMAYRYELPVLPIVIHYRKVSGWRKLLGIKHPLITVSVCDPIVPDKNNGRKAECLNMCEKAHKEMCEAAGIIQNKWPAVLEEE